MSKETFFTSVGCMDGRVQDPVEEFGKAKFHAQFPDTLTEAGLVGMLAKKPLDHRFIISLKKKLLISLEKHHSRGILVHGHQECAGNQVDDETHIQNILRAADIIADLTDHKVPVVGLFVKREDEEWIAEEIKRKPLISQPKHRDHYVPRFLEHRPFHILGDYLRRRQER